MKKEVKKKKTRTKYDIAYICMLVIAILIILGTGTYAYYRSTINGTTSGTIAKWSFTANNQTSTMNLNFGSLYPGKTGVYNLELSAENSDLPVSFELIFHYPSNDNAAFGLFANVFFDNEYILGPGQATTDSDFVAVGMKGYILGGEKVTIPIYYNWPYNREEIDFSIEPIGHGNVSAGITIKAHQMNVTSLASMEETLIQDLLNLTDRTSCSNSVFGYPCELYFTPVVQYVLHQGEEKEIELGDGSTTTALTYGIFPIIVSPEPIF